MQITKENTDSLNAIVKLEINKDDYSPKVEKILKDYRKTANIPGFRKGHVPMGMIKRQYGQAVVSDEVNKLIQDSLNKFIHEEKLDILGNPIPKEQADFSWDADNYKFEFELGLAPEINIDFNNSKAIKHYKIVADKEMVEDQIKHIQRQFGKLVTQNEVKEGYTVVATFKNTDKGIDKESSFKLEDFNGKQNKALFTGLKVGETVEVSSEKLFKSETVLANHLGISEEKAKGLTIDLHIEINEINEHIPHELNQELFDKYTREEGKISSKKELEEEIKKQAEEQFKQHGEQQLFNDISEYLIENIKFDLPVEFLQKWIKLSAEKELTDEEAKAEYEKSEKGIRYQLIEAKIIKEHDIKVQPDEVKELMKNRIRLQMAQYGVTTFTDEQIEEFSNQMLSNEDEVKKVSEQVLSDKILALLKENLKLKEKEVSFKEFADENYK